MVCQVPGCRCYRSRGRHDQWICQRHWKLADGRLRDEYKVVSRALQKFCQRAMRSDDHRRRPRAFLGSLRALRCDALAAWLAILMDIRVKRAMGLAT
jgi:hypothetical protein